MEALFDIRWNTDRILALSEENDGGEEEKEEEDA
jgi:hypothetical protein